MPASVNRIIIIGGGIGGLATALGLQRRGFKVSVYERAREMLEIGAGLAISQNVIRALIDLGVHDELARISYSGAALHVCNYATGDVLRRLEAKPGEHPNLSVHRGDLHGLLLKAVRENDPGSLHPAHAFERLEQDREGVTVHFANGVSDRAEAVIGADGNASAVRSFLFPGEPPKFNGQVAYRALAPWDRLPESVRDKGAGMYGAPYRYLLHYPLRGATLMNLIGVGQASDWQEEGWSIPATVAEFEATYSDYAPDLIDTIRAAPEGGLFKWGLRDREPLKDWTVGRVTMMGDAAHPMTPFLGQGACLAIEDAMVLSRAFAESDSIDEALQRYEAARKPRGTNVQLWSREQGLSLQDPTRSSWRSPDDLGLTEYDPVTTPI